MSQEKKVVYAIYSPAGWTIRTYDNRKQAYAFLEGLNWYIPEWHYDELYKIQAIVVDKDFITYK